MQAENNEDFFHQIQGPDQSNNRSMRVTSSASSVGRFVEPSPKSNTRILFVLLKGIITALIMAMFLLLLGIVAMALVHFIIEEGALHIRRLRRSSSSSPPSSQFPSDSVTAAYSSEELHRSLTSIEYSEAETTEKECAICLDCFMKGDLVRSLPDCSHAFHSNCVGKWLMRVANCPICRRRVVLNTTSASADSSDKTVFGSLPT